jgi:translation initiation factor IF-3
MILNLNTSHSSRRFRINEEIGGPSVRVVDTQNINFGVFTVVEAINLAKGLGLDLVEIARDAHPAICKLIRCADYQDQLDADD